LSATVACAAPTDEVLLEDDFGGYEPRMFSAGVVGAHAEYHFLPEVAAQGNWQVSCFRSEESQRAWRVVRHRNRPAMLQASTTTAEDARTTHPMIVAGDPLWSDTTVEVDFEPESDAQPAGLAFRYQNDRCYYLLAVAHGRAVLSRANHARSVRTADVAVLGEKPIAWKPGRVLTARATVEGDRVRAWIDGALVADVRDATFPAGRVALLADGPTYFYRVRVTAPAEVAATTARAIAARVAEEHRLQAANPALVVWKKLSTPGFGTGRQVRFGDLDGDGRIDLLFCQVRRHGPKDRNSEVGCLTATNLDGKVLWQIGEPDPWNDLLTNDVAVQVHDVDHDGRTEVIYAKDQLLIVADGATGKTLRQIPTPENRTRRKPYDKFPHILGDALFFADFRGRGWDGDILIKDRYEQFWVFTDQLELLWSGTANTGHYPFAADVDGDGRDELAIGYRLYDHDGTLFWNREDKLTDHADGVAIVDFDQTPGAEPRLLNAASDEGMVFFDLRGNILRQHFIGHVQNPATANLRDDLPGLETVSINFWGNQGITTFFDARGEITLQCEPIQYGSMMLPVNWNGGSEELILLSPDVREGGLLDGWGRRAVVFPADGHPVQCNAALDLTGDCRDEIVVWDSQEVWAYTQADNPRVGRLYRPQRSPQYNSSNYQATVSLPGWQE
jgi:rhamnogalacturonan endolyase